MAESMLQRQLDEVRALLLRARELFGPNPVAPPQDIAPRNLPGARTDGQDSSAVN